MPQVHFLPWAGLTTPRTIGPVTLTPWTTIRTTLPAQPRQFLDNYFAHHRTNTNQPIADISIASITANPLQNITTAQRATIRRAIDALTFASTIPNLRTALTTGNNFGIPNSERFQLTTQLLGTYQPAIAISTRSQTHLWNINQIHFCTPWDAGSTTYQIDDELLDGLGKLLTGKRAKRLRERLFRTIEWFRLSNTGSPETSDESRLVMKATAFEVLLEPQHPIYKRSEMAARLNTLTADAKLRTKTLTFGKKTRIRVNAIAAWLNDYYELRNAIVHGKKIAPNRLAYTVAGRQLPQLAIADLVLWEAITWELIAQRFLGTSSRRSAHSFARALGKKNASDQLIRAMTSSHFQFDTYQTALGWRK